ncbi:ribosome biogenesis GTPase Der [Buchnera aphidicola]|uniref:ribosome biogenesis GTPase Der n=1 Tax=Buchnera aphidicola TaxID=9 RepID=UPI003464633A
MIPNIVLIGRNNVGKSTLFNKLTNSSSALVGNFSGLTRDRKCAYIKIENKKIILTDTAGIIFKTNKFEKEIMEQTYLALDKADLILFVVNAKESILPEDYYISKKIRKNQKKVLLIINKIDCLQHKTESNEFFRLGFKKNFCISAIRGTGINELIKEGIISWIKNKKIQKNILKAKEYEDSIKVAFIGAPNVGKSTLINKIINKKRLITSNISGTTRDSINIPIKKNNKNYILIDTAGIRKKNKIREKIQYISIQKTFENIKQTEILLFVIDISKQQINKEDLLIAKKILEAQKSIIVVFNKCDLLNQQELKKIYPIISKKLNFLKFCQFQFISAIKNKGINRLLDSINITFNCFKKRSNSAKLTKILQFATEKHQPPYVKGRRIKLKYAHPGGFAPMIIVIHGNQINYLSTTYKKYLTNYFQKSLKLIGAPVTLFFKENQNPFKK